MAESRALASRKAAIQILMQGSLSQLRIRLRAFLHFSSLLNPKRFRGILIMAAIASLTVRAARSKRRRRFWIDMMRCAVTYEDWAHAAKMLDKEIPRKGDDGLFDEELIKMKLLQFQRRRREGSLREIAFFLRTDLIRNLGNMCNPKLHNGRLQVPKLISDYIEEVSAQLKMICKSKCQTFSLEERISFMEETRHAFGRTALLLSGGATLAAFHLGVVKVLVDGNLLPRVLAGSSAGSIICAIIATKSREEIESFFQNSLQTIRFFDRMGGLMAIMRRVVQNGAIHEIRVLQRLMMDITQNMTFKEAFDRTGTVLGITVTSPRKNEPSRCLNYLTSPNVLIWSAVTASCAFPGLFEAQELMARDKNGHVRPYHPPLNRSSARRWRDGTLESDLPMMQLKELFNVNHFIVSQANPHIAPWLRVKETIRTYAGDFSWKVANVIEMEVKHRFSQLLELGYPLRGLAKIFTQDWEGDITVVMPATLAQFSKLIVNPSFMDLKMALNQGSRCTWEKLSAIQATCAIEFAIDESAALLHHLHRQKNPSFMKDDLLFDSLGSTKIPKSPKLSRAASSKRLADVVQSLDIFSVKDSQRSRIEGEMREEEKKLLLEEGDLLQAEKLDTGFVLNVVKKEDYVLTPKTGNPDVCHVSYSESSSSGDDEQDDVSTATKALSLH